MIGRDGTGRGLAASPRAGGSAVVPVGVHRAGASLGALGAAAGDPGAKAVILWPRGVSVAVCVNAVTWRE